MDIVILLGVIFIALVVQLVVDAIKVPIAVVMKYEEKEDRISALVSPFLSILFSVILCLLADCDLFIAFGYPLLIPYVGQIFTGLVASLGAGKIYDLLKDFQDYHEKLITEKATNKQKEDGSLEDEELDRHIDKYIL